jgi:hypothetical protein
MYVLLMHLVCMFVLHLPQQHLQALFILLLCCDWQAIAARRDQRDPVRQGCAGADAQRWRQELVLPAACRHLWRCHTGCVTLAQLDC